VQHVTSSLQLLQSEACSRSTYIRSNVNVSLLSVRHASRHAKCAGVDYISGVLSKLSIQTSFTLILFYLIQTTNYVILKLRHTLFISLSSFYLYTLRIR